MHSNIEDEQGGKGLPRGVGVSVTSHSPSYCFGLSWYIRGTTAYIPTETEI